jgi:phosphoribosyl-AMP cyclohydrolase / phosphoribosyl-ATP pyrophosphohydrolase
MLIGSIDIINGKAVQLKGGKELVIESERNPLELAREFNRFGEVAVIDLDAAMGKGSNASLVEELCKVADVRVGGGIRDVETARRFLKAGAKRLILGTAATPELLSQFPPELMMVALDHRKGVVTDQGWQSQTGETVQSRADRLKDYCGSFLCTFVEHEGGLGGIPMDEVKALQKSLPRPVTVAGGISKEEEIVQVSKLGMDVQVGMALYKGLIDPVNTLIDSLTFNDQGLIPTIVQDAYGQQLMLAYSSPESIKLALKQGKGIYYSRSRKEIWEKGKTSGHMQELISCRADCDRDTLLFTVKQTDAACHTNSYSCFGSHLATPEFSVPGLFDLLKQRKKDLPEDSYTTTLFNSRKKLLKKISEEAFEVVTYESKENLRWEIADLLYFVSTLAVAEGIEWQDIVNELGGRRKPEPAKPSAQEKN